MSANSIPQPAQPIAGTLKVDATWYRWLRDIETAARQAGGEAEAQLEALCRKLGSPDGSIAGIPDPSSASGVAGQGICLTGDPAGAQTITATASAGLVVEGPTTVEAFASIDAALVARVIEVVAGANVTVDNTDPQRPVVSAIGGGGSINVEDEGSTVVTGASAINFVGAGVTVTESSGVATVTVPGGVGGGAAYFPGQTPIIFTSVDTDTNFISFGAHNFVPAAFSAASALVLNGASIITSLPRGRAGGVPGGTQLVNSSVALQTRPRVVMANTGGWEFVHVFSPDNNPMTAAHRLFIGLSTRTSGGDLNPSTLTNIIGIGYDSGDTQFQFMCNDGSGVATKVALGALFPKPTTREQALFRVVLSWDGSVLSWALTNLSSNLTASGTATTDLPASAVALRMDSFIAAGGVLTNAGYTHVCSSIRSVF